MDGRGGGEEEEEEDGLGVVGISLLAVGHEAVAVAPRKGRVRGGALSPRRKGRVRGAPSANHRPQQQHYKQGPGTDISASGERPPPRAQEASGICPRRALGPNRTWGRSARRGGMKTEPFQTGGGIGP